MFLTQNQLAHKGVTGFSILLWARWEHVSITWCSQAALQHSSLLLKSVVLKGLGHNGFSFLLFAHHQPTEATQPCYNRWPWKPVQMYQI